MASKKAAENGNGATPKKMTGPQRAAVQQAFASLASEAVSRADFGRRHGMQYGSRRDIYAAAGYPRVLTIADFLAMYERDPIAARLVDMPAETTWRLPPILEERIGDAGPEGTAAQPPLGQAPPPDAEEVADGTPFTKGVDALADRLGLWRKLARLDRTARLGRYGVLLIGTGADTPAMMKPMGRLRGPDDVLYLAVYREDHAQIVQWETNPRDPRFGLPLLYNLNVAGELSGRAIVAGMPTLTVHWSHVVHAAEHTLGDDVFGIPALRRPFNALFDLQKVSASTAEAFWQRVAGALVGKIDPAAVGVTDEFLADLDDQLKELYHDLRRVIFGQGLEVSRLSDSEPDPSAASKLYIMLAAAGEGIPLRMLVGNETGERASSEDQKSWMGVIAERQAQYAEPTILRPFLDRLVEHGALPKHNQLGYDVVWPEGYTESESEVATANAARAATAKALTPVGGDPMELVEVDEDRNVWLIPHKAGDLSPFSDLVPGIPGAPGGAGAAPDGTAPAGAQPVEAPTPAPSAANAERDEDDEPAPRAGVIARLLRTMRSEPNPEVVALSEALRAMAQRPVPAPQGAPDVHVTINNPRGSRRLRATKNAAGEMIVDEIPTEDEQP